MSEENKTAQAPANEPSMATAPTGAPAGTPVQELTVQDLGVLKTIIEVAQSRGAFKANELEAVGKTYSKLESFLASIQNQQVAKDPNALQHQQLHQQLLLQVSQLIQLQGR